MKRTRVTVKKYLNSPWWSRFKFFFLIPVAIPYMICIVVGESWREIWSEFKQVVGFVFLPWETKDKD